LSQGKLIATRDPYGIRPLYFGRLKNKDGEFYLLSSETCAIDQTNAETIREINPGEMLVFSEEKMESKKRCASCEKSSLCIFEKIYLSRPDSIINDLPNEMFRHKLGKTLFLENPDLVKKIDLIVPVPDSGIPSAIGFHSASQIPYGRGIIKTPQAKRLFIDPTSSVRTSGVRLKLNVLKPLIFGKRVGVVDDSIVRGSTSREIVKMLREAGAKEVHLLTTCPPIRYPCYYGIDMSTPEELIASKLSIKKIAEHLKADGLYYLSLSGLMKTVGGSGFCTACFDKNYPIAFDCMG
jgi:amidophosphoribosyltransferase